MNITTDIYLKGPDWDNVLETLRGTLFKSFWQVYAICAAIGIMKDKTVSFDLEGEWKYIPRNVLQHSENVALLDFMFQCAILSTKETSLSEEQRLELAFGDDDGSFNRLAFLTKFANYGVTELEKCLSDSDNILETMEQIATYLNTSYELGMDEEIVSLLLEEDE